MDIESASVHCYGAAGKCFHSLADSREIDSPGRNKKRKKKKMKIATAEAEQIRTVEFPSSSNRRSYMMIGETKKRSCSNEFLGK
jgi:hypothetical protein